MTQFSLFLQERVKIVLNTFKKKVCMGNNFYFSLQDKVKNNVTRITEILLDDVSPPFIYSLNKYSLNIYYVLCFVLGVQNTVVWK